MQTYVIESTIDDGPQTIAHDLGVIETLYTFILNCWVNYVFFKPYALKP